MAASNDYYDLGGIHICDDFKCETKNCNNVSAFLVLKNHDCDNVIEMCQPCLTNLEKKVGYKIEMCSC